MAAHPLTGRWERLAILPPVTAQHAGDSGVDHAAFAYQELRARLRLNFRVALWTNLLSVALLIGATVAAAVLVMLGHEVPAAIIGGLSIVDIAWAISERPWQELLKANNRIALTESVWIAYLDTKQAAAAGADGSGLLYAQNLWIDRMATVAGYDPEAAARELRDIHTAAAQRVTLGLSRSSRTGAGPMEGFAQFKGGSTGRTLADLEKELQRPDGS